MFVHLEDFDLRWVRGANIKTLQIRLKHSLKDKSTHIKTPERSFKQNTFCIKTFLILIAFFCSIMPLQKSF